MNYKQIDKLIMKYIFVIALLVLAITNWPRISSGLEYIYGGAAPVINAVIIAYILNLLMVRYEHIWFPKTTNQRLKNLRRPMSLVLALLTIILVIIIVLGIVLPQLISIIAQLIEDIPRAAIWTQSFINDFERLFPEVDGWMHQLDMSWTTISANAIRYINDLGQRLLSFSLTFVTSSASRIFNLLLSFILAIYMLLSKEKIIYQVKRIMRVFLRQHWYDRIIHVSRVINDSFISFTVGTVIEAAILGTMVAVGMFVTGFPYAGMIGALTGVTSFIPFLGAYISAAVGFVMILADSPVKALWFIVLIIVLQQIESNLIYPRVVGNSIGLPGVWVLAAVTVGGSLYGVTGMVIGVPIAAASYKLLRMTVQEKESIMKQRDENMLTPEKQPNE
ncbi:AI-2E family transporter [Dolosicoccus paucivorans]|uniref:AI-2E family transporter n=1 Tax=Dolosicoccus paucivorans TaxID=84521 RepID=UPI000885EAB1|nr:AI-2E family transporter [Dolosicoccus paucivorans]SDI44028.1 Predicted PurR-regulated permease PerM [Dolosicoccus paucivorans]